MATFPSLRPSDAPIIFGAWPATAHTSLNGAESRIRHGSAEIGREWRPSFVNITEADFLAILNHYRGQRSGFDSFGFDTTTLASDLTPAGFAWLYASRPEVVDHHVDCFTVQCKFKCEPRGLVVAPGKRWRTAQTTFSRGPCIEFDLYALTPDPPGAYNLLTTLEADYVLGYTTQVSVSVKVKKVGVFVPVNASLANYTIGIWNATNYSDANPVLGPLVWQKQIVSTDNDYIEEQSYYWFNVSNGPVLSNTQKYVVASTWGAGVSSPFRLDSNTLQVNNFLSSFGRPANTFPVESGLLVDLSSLAIAETYTPNESDVTSGIGFLTVNLNVSTCDVE